MYKRKAAFCMGLASSLSTQTLLRQVVIIEAKNGNTVTVYKGRSWPLN